MEGHVAQFGEALGDVAELQALGGPVGPVDEGVELAIAQVAVVSIDNGAVPSAGENEGGGHGLRGERWGGFPVEYNLDLIRLKASQVGTACQVVHWRRPGIKKGPRRGRVIQTSSEIRARIIFLICLSL